LAEVVNATTFLCVTCRASSLAREAAFDVREVEVAGNRTVTSRDDMPMRLDACRPAIDGPGKP
jgi:hypothetical protein